MDNFIKVMVALAVALWLVACGSTVMHLDFETQGVANEQTQTEAL